MKSVLVTIFFCIISLNVVQSQISGQLFQYDLESPTPGVYIYFEGEKETMQSDFDGFFNLQIPNDIKKSNLIFNFVGLTLKIQNIELNKKEINLGKFILPEFKSIEIDEFNKLSKLEKEGCQAIYCWGQLLGYLDTSKLENDYLELNCEEKITDFQYDPKSKMVKIDWHLIKDCQ